LDDALGQLLSDFARTEGGTLLVGVENKGPIAGIPQEEVEATVERLARVAGPLGPANAGVGVVEVEGRRVVCATVGNRGPRRAWCWRAGMEAGRPASFAGRRY
jgi:predicted HTH transcriptional regulator